MITKSWAGESKSHVNEESVACLHDIRGARAALESQLLSGMGDHADRYFQAYEQVSRICGKKPSDRTFGQIWKFGKALEFFDNQGLRDSGAGPIEALRYIGVNQGDRSKLNSYVDEYQSSYIHTSKG